MRSILSAISGVAVLGCGVARGQPVDGAGVTVHHETVIENYCSATTTPWLNVSPPLQYVMNPSGSQTADDAAALGLRIEKRF